jgi:hypothetical protein
MVAVRHPVSTRLQLEGDTYRAVLLASLIVLGALVGVGVVYLTALLAGARAVPHFLHTVGTGAAVGALIGLALYTWRSNRTF